MKRKSLKGGANATNDPPTLAFASKDHTACVKALLDLLLEKRADANANATIDPPTLAFASKDHTACIKALLDLLLEKRQRQRQMQIAREHDSNWTQVAATSARPPRPPRPRPASDVMIRSESVVKKPVLPTDWQRRWHMPVEAAAAAAAPEAALVEAVPEAALVEALPVEAAMVEAEMVEALPVEAPVEAVLVEAVVDPSDGPKQRRALFNKRNATAARVRNRQSDGK